jgi:hypothetical protein
MRELRKISCNPGFAEERQCLKFCQLKDWSHIRHLVAQDIHSVNPRDLKQK